MGPKYTDIYIIRDNALKQREFIALNHAFKAADIPMAPIKGVALLYELNSYAETRPMADIDILVKKEDVDKAKDLLSGLNYKIQDKRFSENYYLNSYHHLPFHGKYLLELHWYLSPPRPNNIILPELWARVRQIQYGKDIATLLSAEDTIFSLVLHLRRFNDPFSIKYIQDISEVLKKHGTSLDWQYISKYSGLNRLNSLIYYTLLSIKIKLGWPVSIKTINIFHPGILRAFLLKFFINAAQSVIASDQRERSNLKISDCFCTSCLTMTKIRKYAYVFLRFLLYDRLWDFLKFIILIPEEEFSRFYSIRFPSKKSSIIYTLRFLSIPFLFLCIKPSRKPSI
jgi:hypothetical protein